MNFVRIHGITIDLDNICSYLITKDYDSWECDENGKGKVIKFIPKQRVTKEDFGWAEFKSEEECAAVADWLDKYVGATVVKIIREENITSTFKSIEIEKKTNNT